MDIYFASTPKDEKLMKKFTHEYCIASYQYCIDRKLKGHSLHSIGEGRLSNWLWKCMKEKRK